MPRTPSAFTKIRTVHDDLERAWRVIRYLKTFTIPQVMAIADVKRTNLRKYVKVLVQTGCVVVTQKNRSGEAGSYSHYFLVRDLGPKRPLKRKDGTIYDPNHDEVYGVPK